ncbi:hypothetical protein T265_11888 [Opisthorchis viverrini]|uniref:Uncharacterized protein n=1 Tax=Opisthorchis viverrini TaxID=6198 RepID=A0A074YXA7_OPIVI|nr:hypothetical protein T265_11888 [Opisthorchis viverrini]KER19283.1 hypothetical protein T265_11888 [Opisthorchis viverrini]
MKTYSIFSSGGSEWKELHGEDAVFLSEQPTIRWVIFYPLSGGKLVPTSEVLGECPRSSTCITFAAQFRKRNDTAFCRQDYPVEVEAEITFSERKKSVKDQLFNDCEQYVYNGVISDHLGKVEDLLSVSIAAQRFGPASSHERNQSFKHPLCKQELLHLRAIDWQVPIYVDMARMLPDVNTRSEHTNMYGVTKLKKSIRKHLTIRWDRQIFKLNGYPPGPQLLNHPCSPANATWSMLPERIRVPDAPCVPHSTGKLLLPTARIGSFLLLDTGDIIDCSSRGPVR